MRDLSGLLLVLAMVIPVVSHAEDAVARASVVLDGQEFKRDQLERAFFSSVFTKDILNEPVDGIIQFNYPDDFDDSVDDFLGRKNLRENFPWLYPHIYIQTPPRLLSVNKWNQPIRISFGMPNDLERYNKEGTVYAVFDLWGSREKDVTLFKGSDRFKLLEDQIVRFSKDISDQSKIDISYLPRDHETIGRFGNVRINLISLADKNPNINQYIYKTRGGGTISLGFIQSYEYRMLEQQYLKNGFVFTASSKKQVDGYILSNGKNEIEMAVCYIWVGHELEMMKSLINECILRSLGFPGFVYPAGMKDPVALSYLGPWNDPDTLNVFDKSTQGKIKTPMGLSEFDKFMIQTLYRPEIKPGMDYIQVRNILRSMN
jgi:hypothetical protein